MDLLPLLFPFSAFFTVDVPYTVTGIFGIQHLEEKLSKHLYRKVLSVYNEFLEAKLRKRICDPGISCFTEILRPSEIRRLEEDQRRFCLLYADAWRGKWAPSGTSFCLYISLTLVWWNTYTIRSSTSGCCFSWIYCLFCTDTLYIISHLYANLPPTTVLYIWLSLPLFPASWMLYLISFRSECCC